MWYYVSNSRWTVAVELENGRIKTAPPIVRWAIGKPLSAITNAAIVAFIGGRMLMCRQCTLPKKPSCKYRKVRREGTLVTVGRKKYFVTYVKGRGKWAVLKQPCSLLGLHTFDGAFDAIRKDVQQNAADSGVQEI